MLNPSTANMASLIYGNAWSLRLDATFEAAIMSVAVGSWLGVSSSSLQRQASKSVRRVFTNAVLASSCHRG